MSIVFDRAVEFYDQTRGLPDEIADLPINALIRETNLSRGSKALEIGVGTGRIAIPLALRLGRLIGIDLSMPMMGQLVAKLAATPLQLDLARADVVRLPFPGDCFDVIYAVHVLHLVDGWRLAVGEAKRALKSNGWFVASWHRRKQDSPNVVLRRELHRLVEDKGVNTKRPGAQSEDEILEELEKWEGELRVVDVADWTEPSTPLQIIEELDRQIYSETWMIPRAIMDQVIPQLRESAEEIFGSLTRVIYTPYNFRWLMVRKPHSK
jgi:ubiquinone/menaquinone biosynthesis C-methylase UbiE